ncbi:hypothetical protein [Glycomyces sp. YM15]|uniref:hypothetical protein n=1 Tax=Glycomyces sp. YM15 TaxID=2800446 RepID=UPI001965BFA8|nr:hypothetical protein [Glycomyces sp. YM15]
MPRVENAPDIIVNLNRRFAKQAIAALSEGIGHLYDQDQQVEMAALQTLRDSIISAGEPNFGTGWHQE